MSEEKEQVIAFLREFFVKMQMWQISCNRLCIDEDNGLITHEDCTAKMLDDLRAIYDAYCEYKKFPNNTVSSRTPSYCPEKEEITEISAGRGRIFVLTHRKTIIPHVKLKYTIKKTTAGYRILTNRQRFDEYEKQYVPWDLML